MRLSLERLTSEAASTGFRPEILEKVIQLLGLLEGFTQHPYLKSRIALKGGTALNLFVFDAPRLSVDIDLNYMGALDRETMLTERPKVEQAIRAVCGREEFALERVPNEHAGGKWRLRYESVLGQGGNLEIDLNFMFRIPLWPLQIRNSRSVGSYSASNIPLLDEHEIAAGKIAALLSRRAARDLFDVHQLLTSTVIDPDKLRLAFVVYGAMNRRDWRNVSNEDIGFETRELREMLLPVLRANYFAAHEDIDGWARGMVERAHDALSTVLPFNEAEQEFLDGILDHGHIEPSLLTNDPELSERILCHPSLLWKAQNVGEFRGA